MLCRLQKPTALREKKNSLHQSILPRCHLLRAYYQRKWNTREAIACMFWNVAALLPFHFHWLLAQLALAGCSRRPRGRERLFQTIETRLHLFLDLLPDLFESAHDHVSEAMQLPHKLGDRAAL